MKEEREDEGNRGGEKRYQGQAYEGGNEMGAKEGEDEEKTHQREKAGTKRGMRRRGKMRGVQGKNGGRARSRMHASQSV